MPATSKRRRPATDRRCIYDEITQAIIADLVAGRFPWAQPWESSGVATPLGLPRNAASARAYSGINILILWGAAVARGFSCQSWLTFRQALALGGNVREGERGTTVVYADCFSPKRDGTPPAIAIDDAWKLVFGRNGTLHLDRGMTMRRSLVMGHNRVELTGFDDAMVDRLKADGLMTEIIAWKLRVFVPVGPDGSATLAHILARHPAVRVIDRAAA